MVYQFLLVGEPCSGREKSRAIVGTGHSIIVTSKGSVYTFGLNSFDQLHNDTTEEDWQPRLVMFLLVILEVFFTEFKLFIIFISWFLKPD